MRDFEILNKKVFLNECPIKVKGHLMPLFSFVRNQVLWHFPSTVRIMFQVDPSKHRLLLEVFDENRLVSV